MPDKKCTKCGAVKPFDSKHFAVDRGNKSGLRSDCRECNRKTGKERQRRNQLKHKFVPTPDSPKAANDDFEIIVDEPTLTPLEQAYAERDKAKAARDLKTEHKSLLEENVFLKNKIEELVRMQRPFDILVYKQEKSQRCDAIPMFIFSDWHVEEPVEAASVHGLNEYNLDIAQDRAKWVFINALKLANMAARDSIITTINIDFLGDFFSNWIHEELLSGNLLPPGEAARFFQQLIVSGIEFILKESNYIITGDMIPGNHGRLTKKMHINDPSGTSLETFAYHAIVDRFHGNPRVQLRVAEHPMVYRTYFEKFVVRKIHGYEVKYGGGVGGLTIPLNKAIAQWDIAMKADVTLLGHFHQKFDGGRFLVNGSLIGYNSFAQAIRAGFEEAQQMFWLLHARNGGTKSLVAPIWLDNKHTLSLEQTG